MPRLEQVSRATVWARGHKTGKFIYNLMFGDRDPVEEPGTDTGSPGNWWTVFAQSPDTFDHACGLFSYYQSPDRELDPKLRELGQMRVGWACGSQFVFSQHCKAARDHGVTEEQIAAIPSWQVSDTFTPVERAVLAYTDGMAYDHGRVPDATFAILKANLSDVAILELSYIVGSYLMHAVTSRAMRLEFDDVDEPTVEVPDPNGNYAGLFRMPDAP